MRRSLACRRQAACSALGAKGVASCCSCSLAPGRPTLWLSRRQGAAVAGGRAQGGIASSRASAAGTARHNPIDKQQQFSKLSGHVGQNERHTPNMCTHSLKGPDRTGLDTSQHHVGLPSCSWVEAAWRCSQRGLWTPPCFFKLSTAWLLVVQGHLAESRLAAKQVSQYVSPGHQTKVHRPT